MINILFLTEGGANIGLGHLSRCLALSQSFEASKKKVLINFVVDGDETACNYLKRNNINTIKLKWWQNPSKLRPYITSQSIIIIDSYRAPSSFYKSVANFRDDMYLVAIDDFNRLNYEADLVINPTLLNKKDIGYEINRKTRYLTGREYVIIKKEYWLSSRKVINKNINTVMITFGGNDLRNLTPRILKHLNYRYPNWKKIVIVGKGFKNTNEIVRHKTNKVRLIFDPPTDLIKRIMTKTDIAISAAGQTLYELAKIGVPVAAILIADNQLVNIKGWQKNGYLEYAGSWKDSNLMLQLEESLEKLATLKVRKLKSAIGKRNIDGLGCNRITNYILRNYQVNV